MHGQCGAVVEPPRLQDGVAGDSVTSTRSLSATCWRVWAQACIISRADNMLGVLNSSAVLFHMQAAPALGGQQAGAVVY